MGLYRGFKGVTQGLGVSESWRTLLGGPHNKGYHVLASILSPYLWRLSHEG